MQWIACDLYDHIDALEYDREALYLLGTSISVRTMLIVTAETKEEALQEARLKFIIRKSTRKKCGGILRMSDTQQDGLLMEMIRAEIENAMRTYNNNQKLAAAYLGITPRALNYQLSRLCVDYVKRKHRGTKVVIKNI